MAQLNAMREVFLKKARGWDQRDYVAASWHAVTCWPLEITSCDSD